MARSTLLGKSLQSPVILGITLIAGIAIGALPILLAVVVGIAVIGFLFSLAYRSDWKTPSAIARAAGSQLLLQTNPLKAGFSGAAQHYWRELNPVTTEASRPGREPTPSDERPSNARPEVGICAVDRLGTINFANRTFRKICDVTEREILGKRIDSIAMTPELKEALIALVSEREAAPSRKIEVRSNRLPKNVRYFEIVAERADVASTTTSLSDNPEDLIITLVEITERRAIESHLLEAQKLSSLGKLISGMAHSVSNTLTTIMGYASLLSSEDVVRNPVAAKEIKEACENAGKLLQQLVGYAQGKPQALVRQAIQPTVDNTVELLRGLILESTIISVHHLESEQIAAALDRQLLTQALSNLILNAQESYQGKPARIVIETGSEKLDAAVCAVNPAARPGTYCWIRVRDSGCGMSPDTLRRAGEPLFTTKRDEGHTGLGLASTHAVIRSMDGFLLIESQLGKGTGVTVYLPRTELKKQAGEKAGAVESPVEPSTAEIQSAAGACRILVVEDDDSVRPLVSQMLGALGYSVEAVASGEEAVSLLGGEKFELMLLDYILPKMNGTELLALARAKDPAIKTLVMSGYGAETDESGTIGEVLAKPFDIDALDRSITKALGVTQPLHALPEQ